MIISFVMQVAVVSSFCVLYCTYSFLFFTLTVSPFLFELLLTCHVSLSYVVSMHACIISWIMYIILQTDVSRLAADRARARSILECWCVYCDLFHSLSHLQKGDCMYGMVVLLCAAKGCAKNEPDVKGTLPPTSTSWRLGLFISNG